MEEATKVEKMLPRKEAPVVRYTLGKGLRNLLIRRFRPTVLFYWRSAGGMGSNGLPVLNLARG